jgi:hypothetical protein
VQEKKAHPQCRECAFFGHLLGIKKRPAEAGEHRSLDLQIYAQSIAQIKKTAILSDSGLKPMGSVKRIYLPFYYLIISFCLSV